MPYTYQQKEKTIMWNNTLFKHKTFYNVYYYCLVLMTVCLSLPLTSATAQTSPELSGQGYIQNVLVHTNPENTNKGDSAYVHIHLAARIWTLLGEPVHMCTAWWELSYINIGTQVVYKAQIPDEVLKTIRIWDAQFMLHVYSDAAPSNPVVFRCDAGEFWSANLEKPSFNVPGSRGWDKLFWLESWEKNTHEQIDQTSAKSILKHDSSKFEDQLYSKNVESLKLDLGEVYDWVEEYAKEGVKAGDIQFAQLLENDVESFDTLFDTLELSDEIENKKTLIKEIPARKQTRTKNKSNRVSYNESIRKNSTTKNTVEPKVNQKLLDYLSIQKTTASELLIAQRGNNGLWGYTTKNGTWIIPAQFQMARDFSDQRAAVLFPNKLWGYIDVKGDIVINPNFKKAGNFENGVAIVAKNENKGLIDRNGKTLIDFTWYNLSRSEDRKIIANTKTDRRKIGYKTTRKKACGRMINDKNPEYERSWYTQVYDLNGNTLEAKEKKSERYSIGSGIILCRS